MKTEYKPVVLHCKECKKDVRILIKMGGLLCARCRTIIEEAYSPKWKEIMDEFKKRNGESK